LPISFEYGNIHPVKVRDLIKMVEEDSWYCVATGASREEVEQTMREAIEFHLEELKGEGYPVPRPHSYTTYIEVPA